MPDDERRVGPDWPGESDLTRRGQSDKYSKEVQWLGPDEELARDRLRDVMPLNQESQSPRQKPEPNAERLAALEAILKKQADEIAAKKVAKENAMAEALATAELTKKKADEDKIGKLLALIAAKKEEAEAQAKRIEAQEKTTEAAKAPIKFKDAGMEDLIKSAFLHVDVVGPHVHEGHYDLVGPNGDIILPQTWEAAIEPDWQITMHMWPMPKPEVTAVPATVPGTSGLPSNMVIVPPPKLRRRKGRKQAKVT